MGFKSILVSIVALCVFLPRAIAVTYSSGIHNIDYSISDPFFAKGSATINLLSGGYLEYYLRAEDYSQINLLGGTVKNQLYAYEYSVVDISSGNVKYLYTYDNSEAEISGGSMLEVGTRGSSQVDIIGGSIVNNLISWENSQITVFGSGFNFPLGEITASDGTLTGTLMNGDAINARFYIYNDSSIMLVPEPATLLLLGLGGLLLRKRK